MFPKKFFFAAFFLFAFFFFAETQTFACSCAGKPTVLGEFERSDLVIATELVAVNKVREKDEKDKYDIGYIDSVSMRVEKVYKGNAKIGDILTFRQGGGSDCGWTFDETNIGYEYLFYVNRPYSDEEVKFENKDAKLMYYAGFCGRSSGLKGAVDDLLYLNNLAKTRGRSRLSGTLESWSSDKPSFAGVKIKITGKKKIYETKTNANGVYEIYDLPADEYLVEPQMPNGWKISRFTNSEYTEYYPGESFAIQRKSKNQVSIVIDEKRHAALDLSFSIDNAISGKVISPAGKPMKNVCVAAVSTQVEEKIYHRDTNCTNEKGEFNIESLRAGNYILIINDDGKIDGDEPFGTLFYPGIAERKSAGVVAVEAGKFVNNINIQIPEAVELFEIKGQLIYSDGKPVVDEYVKFKVSDESVYNEDSVKSDDSGRFSISIPKGAKGILFAEDYVYESHFDKCTNKAEILKSVGKESQKIKTNEIKIEGEKTPAEVKLSFPFPGCTKVKEQ